jgi:hypothetical protein
LKKSNNKTEKMYQRPWRKMPDMRLIVIIFMS